MGGKASKVVVSKVTKPIKNYNVQNRAQKVFDEHQVTPKVAPKHPSTVDAINRHVEGSVEHPEIKAELDRKNDTVIGRVNQLHIEVTGTNPQMTAAKRPLPQNRKHIADPLLLLENPFKVPEGRLSLTQVAQVLDQHKQAPAQYPAEVVAMKYKLDIHETENLLKYFYKLDLDEVTEKDTKTTGKALPTEVNSKQLKIDSIKDEKT